MRSQGFSFSFQWTWNWAFSLLRSIVYISRSVAVQNQLVSSHGSMAVLVCVRQQLCQVTSVIVLWEI